MNTAREVLDIMHSMSAVEFIELADTLSISPETLIRLTKPKVEAPQSMFHPGQGTAVHPAPIDLCSGKYGITLTSVGVKVIHVIKAVRELTGFGLKESKDIVDDVRHNGRAVQLVVGMSFDCAEAAQLKFNAQGAIVVVRYIPPAF